MQKLKKPPPYNPDKLYDEVLGDPVRKFHREGHYYSAAGKYVDSEDYALSGDLTDEEKEAAQKKQRNLKNLEKARRARAEKAARKAMEEIDRKSKKPTGEAAKVLAGTSVPAEVARAEKENAKAKRAEELAE